MKTGDYVCCTYSEDETYTKGQLYPILGIDSDGDPIIEDNEGKGCWIGQPMDGCIWKFETVSYNPETMELLELLRNSEEDVKAGRILTREQLMESFK